MRKRLERPDREKELVKRIKTEHSLFKFEKLSETNRTIYDACNQIRVYECLTEYFLYHEHFDLEFVELALEKEDILVGLWLFDFGSNVIAYILFRNPPDFAYFVSFDFSNLNRFSTSNIINSVTVSVNLYFNI